MPRPYGKISSIIKNSTPFEKPSRLTEEQVQKLKNASNVALALLGFAGVIALSALAPNMFVAIDKLFLKKSPNRKYKKSEKDRAIAKAFYYLKQHGYIIMKPALGDLKIWLTRLGKKRLSELDFETLQITKPKKWDRKWWQVAADIPTKKYKVSADLLRRKIKDLGLFPLQRTLWFYPYDLRKEMEFLADHYGIGHFVTVMEVSRLDYADELEMKAFFEDQGILKSGAKRFCKSIGF